jgi:hypothetical protein
VTRINLLKRKGKKAMTIDEFKTWLTDLIANKKGALPDLNDWKTIKEKLDSVKAGSGQYSFDFDGSGMAVHVDLELDDMFFKTRDTVSDYTNFDVTYNGVAVTLENTYEAKEIENRLNGDCRGR